MYPDKKACAIIAGVVISSLICESLNKDHIKIPEEHVHLDYSHLTYISTTSSVGAIVSTTVSGSTVRDYNSLYFNGDF